MTPGVVVVVEVLGQDSMQMSFAQQDHVIEALSTDRANHPLAIWVLPGRSRRDRNFFDTHAFDTLDEVVSVDAVVITNEEAW